MLLAIYKASERATYEQTSEGTHGTYLMKNPKTGEAMRRELLMNDSVSLFYSWYIFIVRRLILFNPNQTRHES
jgi:hypothetical protein